MRPLPLRPASDLELTHNTYRYLLRFHTLRRMAPGAKSYGVSIASQRRVLGYWARLLGGDDPRRAAGAGGRKVVLEYVKVSGKGVSGLGKLAAGGSDRIAVQVRLLFLARSPHSVQR